MDNLSKGVAKLVEDSINGGDITIVTKLTLSRSSVESHNHEQSYRTLMAADARYILLIADTRSTSDFYYRARNHSLISPRHVWMGMSPPSSVPHDISKAEAKHSVEGYIIVTGLISTNFTDVQIQILETFVNLVAENPSLNATAMTFGVNYAVVGATYDCTKTILWGLNKLLSKILHQNNYDPQTLANGSLNFLLERSAFSNTGYPGFLGDPLKFDAYGNVEM
ncbi:hypothetical protein HDU76_008582 [Blyttiomyces sp. JEL0837]|nr:hypothetical protein HDU76_008582 [Blyttiomyces sp. JEL0837]